MFSEVFQLAEKISGDTDGAFDITVAPMVNAWGFGFKTGNPPTDRPSTVCVPSWDSTPFPCRMVTSSRRIRRRCSTALPLPRICTDVVARFLKKKGVQNFMVEIGGEIVVNGNSEKLQPWRIGINKPTDDSLNTNQAIQDVVSVSNIAMATSGNYRNFYYKNGKKYAHTIDPKTGYPVQHNILSATVFADDCATADAYATSFMVLGLDGAKKILEKHPELCAYLIYSDQKGSNQIWYSPSLQKKLGK